MSPLSLPFSSSLPPSLAPPPHPLAVSRAHFLFLSPCLSAVELTSKGRGGRQVLPAAAVAASSARAKEHK